MARVSILMSVYNAGIYLDAAVQSILRQTFREFEFIIINDASTDSSVAYLEQLHDPRVIVIHNEQNMGLTRSLNVGLQHLTSEYVARMDADDIAHPQRLEKQVKFLDNHPEYVLIGSSYRLINAQSDVIHTLIKPMDHVELMWLFHSRTALEHGSVTFRHNTQSGQTVYYNESYRTAQDYDFWLKLLKFGKGAVSADLFLDYRQHSKNITSALSEQQTTNLKTIAKDFLQNEYNFEGHESYLIENLIEFLNGGNYCNHEVVSQSIQAISLIANRYISKNALSKNDSEYILRKAHGQVWNAVFNKSNATLMQKLMLSLCFPKSFYFIVKRRILNETFQKTTLRFS